MPQLDEAERIRRPDTPEPTSDPIPCENREGPVEIEVVARWQGFLEMEQEWNRLWEQSPQRDNVFLSHEWFRAWWEAFGENREMLILRLVADGRLVGIAPLMRHAIRYHGLPIRLLSLITNDHTNRAEFILAERSQECVTRVLDFVSREAAEWDMAELDFVPADSPTAEALGRQAGQFGLVYGFKPSYDSLFIPLSGDWEGFYGKLDGRFRRNMKNREKRLASLGEIRYEECFEAKDGFLEEMFAVGEKSWKGTETKTAIASTSALRRFYARLAELTGPKGRLSLHLLRVGGKPIAFHYSLRNDGAIYLLKTEYDLAYQAYSPGHQIQKHVLESCHARGLREFDFLGPDMEWKREWAACARPHVRLLLFRRGVRSRVAAFVELQAKPVLKRSRLIRRLLCEPAA